MNMKFLRLLTILCMLLTPAVLVSTPVTSAYAADIKPALIHTFGNEGGFQADPHDSGNYAHGVLKGTKFGIAAASYPNEDIKGLTLERAGVLYDRDFWSASRCGDWKSQIIANEYFDYAVNLGQGTAARIIQRAINYAGWPLPRIPVDGKIGPATVARLNSIDQDLVYVNLIGLTHNRYVQVVDANPDKERYMKTWTRRIKHNVQRSVHEYEARRR
jgi:lysozyme family protein